MPGKKTHEQQIRTFERKSDVPDARQVDDPIDTGDEAHVAKRGVRQSEYPVSRRGMNQESRHNKHNDPGQSGHKPE